MSSPVYNPGQPSMTPIPGGFSFGKILHVTGTFSPTANSFVMKLQSGQTGDPTDEIGLCIYGRVAEGVIGRNAFTRAAGWGQEEATSSAAFARGQNFDVTILCDPMAFKIALNQNHFAEFSHRTNPSSLTFLNIASSAQDVTVACVWIEDGPGAPQQPQQPPPPQPGFAPPVPAYGPPPPYSGGPGFAPQYPSTQPAYPQNTPNYQPPPQSVPPQQYGQAAPYSTPSGGGMGGKGLLGAVAGAGTAIAGALGASHLLGKKTPSHGYPMMGGYPGHKGGGGGILNKAMGVGAPLATAAMLTKPSKAMKYGVPLAAMGAGGYMMHKGFKHKGFHGGFSSDSSGSSEEE